jgi:hypothetical protein
MRLKFAHIRLLCFGLASWLIANSTLHLFAQQLPQPISTNQAAFAIPYTIPVPKNPQETPTEIRLFVSLDQGRNWKLADSSKLGAVLQDTRGQFVFRAAQDGEFWFALRTVDRQGQLRGGKNGPELRVFVDSQVPSLQVDAQRGAAGEVTVRYQASDPALATETLALSYQINGQGDWRPITLNRTTLTDPRQPLQGTLSFVPDQPGQELTLRGEVRDRAGNVGQQLIRVSATPGVAAQPLQPNPAATTAQTNRPTVNTTTTNDPPPAFPFGDTAAAPSTRWADVLQNKPEPAPTLAPPQYTTLNNPTAQPVPVEPAPNLNQSPLATGPSLFGPGLDTPASTPLQPLTGPIAGRVESQVAPPPTNLQAVPNVDYRTPTGERPRMVNRPSFEWEYELESVGAAGVSKVELWITRDWGNSWKSAGTDPDNRSPIRTTVDREGLYGYRMTVQAAGGAQPAPPRSGDQPEMWIGVDVTKPVARLLQAELGTGSQAGEIAVAWEASDAYLSARPVSLSYSSQPTGPWNTIAAGLENNGRYVWRFDQQTPEKLYLRLEVRDEAGNIGVSETVEPLSLNRLIPQIKLKQVRPVTE